MNEAADLGSSFSAVVLFWLWWAVLSVLNVLSEISKRDAARKGREAAGDDAASEERHPIDPVCREKIRRIDPSFDEHHFMRGAERAYEIVLQAFAAGDLAMLRRLLAPDVLAAFECVVVERLNSGLVQDLTFVGLRNARMVDVAAVEAGMAVSVCFAAEIVSVTRLQDGTLMEGDPHRTIETCDLWSFEPDPSSEGRSWLVTATDSA